MIEDEGAKGTLTFLSKHCNERMELAVNREMLRNWALSSSQRGFRLFSINWFKIVHGTLHRYELVFKITRQRELFLMKNTKWPQLFQIAARIR